ncbi:MAG: Putative membrane protein [Thermoanaerobacterales bacterium 50_218]|nr:MAG: Putative membrane protein [Thermoanaerobacterales bacterium 50_218]HAA89472.1 hypothetical protein [Peptococcaceae bacterium]
MFFCKLNKIEKIFEFILFFVFIALVSGQFLFTGEPFRFYWSLAERMEGVPWEETVCKLFPEKADLTGKVEIELISNFCFPEARVLVNGEEVANFQERKVVVQVQEGDLLQIDGTAYSCELIFRVKEVAPGIIWPSPFFQVETKGNIATIGEVVME